MPSYCSRVQNAYQNTHKINCKVKQHTKPKSSDHKKGGGLQEISPLMMNLIGLYYRSPEPISSLASSINVHFGLCRPTAHIQTMPRLICFPLFYDGFSICLMMALRRIHHQQAHRKRTNKQSALACSSSTVQTAPVATVVEEG